MHKGDEESAHETIQSRIRLALEGIFAEHTEFVGDWILVCNSTAVEDGDTGIWCFGSENLKSWISLGMLTYALEIEKKRIVEDDDDG